MKKRTVALTGLVLAVLGGLYMLLPREDARPTQVAQRICRELAARELTTLVANSSKSALERAGQSEQEVAAISNALTRRIESWPTNCEINEVQPASNGELGNWDRKVRRVFRITYRIQGAPFRHYFYMNHDSRDAWCTNPGEFLMTLLTHCFPDRRHRMAALEASLADVGAEFLSDGRVKITRTNIEAFLVGRIPFNAVPQDVSLY